MRIIRIKGKNIASLTTPFDIDFTIPPLSESDIFTITGATGAGKTTLLDVICLALYDKTPRLRNTYSNNFYYDDDHRKMRADNPALLMHHGSTSCFCEVSFLVNGKTYRARRYQQRAYKRKNGPIQNPEFSLYDFEKEEYYASGKKEVLARIEEIIGLSFDQFTRAVLLAQGDFASFLYANNKEKGEILMNITGRSIFKSISQRIYEHYKENKEKLEKLLINEALINLPNQEELEHTEKKKKELIIQGAELQKKVESLISQEQTILSYKENLEKLLQEKEKRDVLSIKYDNSERLEKIIESVKRRLQYDRLEGERKKLLRDYSKIEKELEQKREDLINHQKKIESHNQTIANLYVTKAKKKDEYEKSRYLRDEAAREEETINEMILSIEKDKLIQQDLLTQKNETETNLALAQKKKEETISKLAPAEKWLIKFKGQEQLIASIPSMLLALKLIGKNKKEIDTCEELIRYLQSKKNQNDTRLSEINEELAKYEKKIPEDIYRLRQSLTDGVACPVCGSPHHPYAHLQSEILSIESKYIEKYRSEAKRLKEELEYEQIRILEKEYAAIEQKRLSRNEIDKLSSEHISTIETLFHTPFSYIDNLEEVSTHLQKIEETYNKCREDEISYRKDLEYITKEIEDDNKKIKTYIERIRSISAKISIDKNTIISKKEKIKSLIGFDSLVELENYKKENLAAIDQQLTAENLEKNASELILNNLLQRIKTLEEEIPDLQKSIEVMDENLTTIKKGFEIPINEIPLWNEEKIKQKEKYLVDLHMQYHTSQQLCKRLQHYINTIIKENPAIFPQFMTVEESEIFYESTKKKRNEAEDERSLLAKKIFEVERFLLDVQKQFIEKNEQIRKIEEQRSETALWTRLKDLFGSADGQLFNQIAQWYTLEDLIAYANRHLAYFNPRYRLRRVPLSLNIEVIDMDMMETRRPVNSLSGGESFLISLAMALGLSEISSNNLPIESLFIDEGFGSLDDQSLDFALSALERLKQNGRNIGIISHVKEIAQRIPVKIEVEKKGNGQSTIHIVGN